MSPRLGWNKNTIRIDRRLDGFPFYYGVHLLVGFGTNFIEVDTDDTGQKALGKKLPVATGYSSYPNYDPWAGGASSQVVLLE